MTKLQKIENGHYETEDGRYRVVHFAGEWALEDRAGHVSLWQEQPHQQPVSVSMLTFRTLKDATAHLERAS